MTINHKSKILANIYHVRERCETKMLSDLYEIWIIKN